jgi:O-antigen/teichoic acid export membrane protein
MIEVVKRLVKHSGIYALGVVLSKSVGFLMIPVYTRLLAPRDYGVLELLDLVLFFAGILAAMGIHPAVFRFYTAYESEQDKKEVIGTALLYNISLSFLVSLALFSFAPVFAQAVLGSSSFAPFIRIVSFTLFFSNLCDVPLAYWRAQGRTILFVCVGLGRTVVSLSLIVLFLVGFKWGVQGVLYANALANGIAGLALSAVVISAVPTRIVVPKLREMVRYGLPIVPSYVVSFLLVFSDRIFLRHYASLTDVGVYSLGYKLAGIVTVLVGGPFSMTWAWQQFELAKRKDGREMYAKIQVYQLLVAVTIGLGVSVFAKDVLRVMTTEPYWGAAHIVPLIVLSCILGDTRGVVISGILVQRATHYLPLIGVVSAITNLVLNYVLISRYKAMGAAVATLLSYAVHLALTYCVAQRVYFVPYQYVRNAAVLASGTAIYLLSTLSDFHLLASLLVDFVLVVSFLGVAFTVLSADERQVFRQLGVSIAQRFGLLRIKAG